MAYSFLYCPIGIFDQRSEGQPYFHYNRHHHSHFSVFFQYSLSLLLFKIQTLISSVSHRRFEIVSDFQSLSGWLLQLDLDLELEFL